MLFLELVITQKAPIGEACKAPKQQGECKACRACWTNKVISYGLH
jgi:hypothetical protein